MSFLDKLKVKVEENEPVSGDEETNKKEASGFLQLDVDIYQTSSDIIVIAPIPGVEVDNLDINIENENDVVTIQGKREMPRLTDYKSENKYEDDDFESKYLRQECQWGPFYRQIILPQEVDVNRVEARFKKGILILKLPLLRLQGKGKKKIEITN
ncbi:hypothetical protein A2331_03465 [Candidatus Falkowbacteria bacterium RIFOXYB2_FULL_34_18]|uniref:SHSP domain-containing protein n=1 Tax=Candidatus Falkowbacteria bacterium RIFOXYD2_FULL_34_120 TaxID=1798007 RepID=A0A1F5TSK4_9BACT|nr:MAG: hypothetical protein A2331_03465 [Candidatus Falkowbacteria bacterium RIFOXYB2_FULL_34_18]OGF30119.1 MAG: hypothetical protein A2500_04985 [Candidatus Falkowbacteria bacterium RIFOXYC12_FULL_34_55]OGF37547.1 MAG: hypothetical protein A2466_01860 [Candidatus Falkowbacteria bacterium RIFOXYC2_FULL_34_220]OGF39303.1 MAG: hypothetical protein A2515_02275 [Candidatus Falkowbacteria bacterium RIFOXYD12_FULL_34_57]OGF41808.1 MAG: hypothetical protein A2531_05260 [Candidatus Falkowbacteria bact